MDTVMDIPNALVRFMQLAVAAAATSWWGWAIWLAVITLAVIGLRRELVEVIGGLRAVPSQLRRAGSNAVRTIRRKGQP
jgi:hypothetical protein